jgi:hypothetical protein
VAAQCHTWQLRGRGGWGSPATNGTSIVHGEGDIGCLCSYLKWSPFVLCSKTSRFVSLPTVQNWLSVGKQMLPRGDGKHTASQTKVRWLKLGFACSNIRGPPGPAP